MAATLSDSPALNAFLNQHGYTLGLVECTERELGTLLRAAENGTDVLAEIDILAEIRERGYIMDPSDTHIGDRVRYCAPLAPAVGAVSALTDDTITVDWGTEQTPGVPGSRYTLFLSTALSTGVLTHA